MMEIPDYNRITGSPDADRIVSGHIVGMSFDEASALCRDYGWRLRAGIIDGAKAVIEARCDPDRLNVAIVDGVIVEMLGRA